MKAQILKIAGVKSEKEFYKKYKTEADFMKVHGKAFKKAQVGASINNAGNVNSYNPLNLQEYIDSSDKLITGSTQSERQALQLAQQKNASQPSEAGGSGGGGLSSMMGMLGGGEGGGEMSGMLSSLGGARYGADIPRAQGGFNVNTYGIGAQTMGRMGGSSAFVNQPGTQGSYGFGGTNYGGPQGAYPPDTSNPNWMQKNTSGAPYESSNINKNYTGYQGEVAEQPSGMDAVMGGIAKQAGPIGELYGGYQALRGERRARKAAEQNLAISNVTRQAAETEDVDKNTQRKYVRPEDNINSGSAFFPVYGAGTNVLARNGVRLQDGGGIGGNPTEIQNTYGNGNSIYDDLEYEPLYNVDQQKSFYHGGRLHSMQDGGGMSPDMYGQIGSTATNLGQTAMGGQNAGGKIGGTAGKAIGNAILPGVGGAVGEFAGGMIGNALDTNAKRMKKAQDATQRNIIAMSLGSAAKGLQGQNQSYMKDGGYMNPEYNPQVITMFGDHNAQDFADYAHKDQYRAGGHLKSYTPPSERAMEIYENGGGVKSYGLGGELQTHWGGGAETMSYNPYLPGTGETVMFRGKSHEEYSPNGETGIGVTYGGNPVEVERGEPMVELEEGGTVDPQTGEVQKSGVVFGNLKIPNQYIDMLGDKSAKGKKFKNYVADLSKGESRQNKIIEKSTNELNGFTPITPFDKLKMTALQANIQGANMKLKDIADKKINAASLQNAINDTAEENGLVADDLARGKVKINKEAMKEYAEYGKSIIKAQDGVTTTADGKKITKAERDAKLKSGEWKVDPSNPKKIKRVKSKIATKQQEKSASAMDKIPAQKYNKETGFAGGVTKEKFEEYKKRFPDFPGWDGFSWKKPEDLNKLKTWFNTESEKRGSKSRIMDDPKTKSNPQGLPMFGDQYYSAKFDDSAKTIPPSIGEEYLEMEEDPEAAPEKNKFNWMNVLNSAIPYLRPSDQESLDYAQLYPEMYAMATNQLEPVPAQGFQPDLSIPYDISYQDQLNANQSDYRATQRMVGYNPAAQAQLNAQKYQANEKVLGEQFRANQAMKDKVYGENRQILNDAKLKNLAIYDQQYGRQAEALSNTKATTQAALSSISDKYAKNKLENRTLGVMENMYNYRFDDSGRAVNMNPLAQLNWQGRGTSSKSSGKGLAEGKGFTYDENGNIVGVRSIGKEDAAKNGKKISAKNGSIVKSYKNI